MAYLDGFHLEQSLPICIALSAIGGVMEVGATAVTAVPAVREKEGIQLKPWVQWLAIAGNVALQAIGSLLSHLIATWFGPVSLVVPFFYSATLLTNMLVFGLLGEQFTKNMKVGTYVIVVAVILLPDVGPQIQEEQDISVLLHHWYSILWFGILLLACGITGALLILDITRYTMRLRTTVLLVARAASISVNLTVSRAFVLGPSKTILVTFVAIKILSGAIYTYAIVVQSYAVEQARFVPLNATLIILVNALTGVIIWEDWRVIETWYAYLCVFVLLGLGCDLLLSVPLLHAENPQFGPKNMRASLLRRKLLLNDKEDDDKKQLYQDIPDGDDFDFSPYSYSSTCNMPRKDNWKELLSPMHGSAVQNAHHSDTYHEHDANEEYILAAKFSGEDSPSPSNRSAVDIGYRLETPLPLLGQGNEMAQNKDMERALSRIQAWRETVSPVKRTDPRQRTDSYASCF